MDNTALIHRLSRAQGQIESIKKTLAEEQESKNCLQTLRQLKAALNALKKFAEAYVSQHLGECLAKNPSKKDLQNGLEEVIHSAFTL